MGWIIHRQGILYYDEYGWDERFEALVAEICARYIQNEDPAREHCWIAERNGEIVGARSQRRPFDSLTAGRICLGTRSFWISNRTLSP